MRKKTKAGDVDGELLSGQSKALLQELHLLTREGDLNADARRKLKQINHFARFLAPAVEDILARTKEPIFVDFGSGNAYLGFIFYEIFLKAIETGRLLNIDARPEFLKRSQERAKTLGFERMEFQEATIEKADLPERVHLVAALHACDTATDDALIRAVRHKADYVFLVPCCQAEVARLLPKNAATPVVSLLYEEPLHRREFASHLTNVLRVLALRSTGYQVTVTELTSWEHTAKAELIIAKRVQGFDRKARQDLERVLQEFSLAAHPLSFATQIESAAVSDPPVN